MRASIFLLILILLQPDSVLSQWEQIGWGGSKVSIHAQLNKTLYGKSSTGYYRSTDWGSTWKLFRKGLPNDNYMYFESQIFNKGNYISLKYGYESDSNYYYAEDADTAWKCQKLSLIEGLSPIYKHDYTFRISTDTFITLFLPPLLYANGYIPGNYGVYFSSDRGKTWQLRKNGIPEQLSDGYYYYKLYKQGKRFMVWTLDYDTVSFTETKRLYKSDNFGETWEPMIYPRQDSTEGEFRAVSDSLFTYDCEQTLYLSQTGGDSWFKISSPLPDSFGTFGIFQQPISYVAKRIYLPIIVSDSSPQRSHREYYFSDDNGSSWSRFYPSVDYEYIDKIFGYADTVVINSWQRTNSVFQGSTPLPISENVFGLDVFGLSRQNLVFVEGTRLFMVNSSDSISRSDDNGNSWTRYSFRHTDSLTFSRWARSGNTIYAVGKDRAKQKLAVYTSTSNGDTWQQLSVLPELWDFDRLIVEDDTIIADHFISTDHGGNWKAMSRPNSNIYDIPILLSFGNGMVAVSQRNEVYESSDLGQTWDVSRKEPESVNDYIIGGIRHPVFSNDDDLFITSYYDLQYRFYRVDKRTGTSKRIYTGFDGENELLVVSFDKGVLYGISKDYLWINHSDARHYKLVYSLDTGLTWKQLGDSVMNGNKLFVGSDYLFLTGGTELWRLPLTTLSITSNGNTIRPSHQFDMYPIPARNEVQITSQSGSSIESIELCDVLGKKVEVPINLSESTAFADLKTLSPGYYIVRIKLSGKYYTRPLIVQK